MSTTGKMIKGLDIDPFDELEMMFAQPDEPVEHIDPAGPMIPCCALC